MIHVARSVHLGSTQHFKSNDSVIESLDQVGMLFLFDISRQECSTYTTTSQQEFDVPDSPTGHREEKGFCSQQTHDGDRSPDVSDTRSHCSQSTLENSTLVRTSQCARRTGSDKSRTSQSARMDQTKDAALHDVHKRHGFTLLTVRRHQLVLGRVYQAGTVRYTRIGAQHPRGWQWMMRTTQHISWWAYKRTALEPVLRTPTQLDYTLLDLCADDKTAQRGIPQDAQKQKKQWTRSHVSEARVQHWSIQGQARNHHQNTSLAGELTNSTEKGTNKRLGSNLTDVLNTQLKDQKTSQTHQRVDVLNTDHKDVAVFRESSLIFTILITLQEVLHWWSNR